jgi:hypothetical protein
VEGEEKKTMCLQTPLGEFKGTLKNIETNPMHTRSPLYGIERSEVNHPKAEDILSEAKRIVHGARNQDYGRPFENFSKIANLINAAFETKFQAGDIPILMILLKISRHRNTYKRDNLVDIAGYAATAEMVEMSRKDGDT